MLLNCSVGENSWESLGLQGDPTSPSWRRSVLGIHWKDWCWSWNSNTLATWCKVPTLWKGPWCWERLKAGGEGMTEAEMIRWHHWHDGHESGQVVDWQGSLACYSPWGLKELDITEPLNWWKWKWKSLSHILFFVTPWTIQSIEFFRPEHGSG